MENPITRFLRWGSCLLGGFFLAFFFSALAHAAGGVNVMPMNDGGMDIYLSTLDTPTAVVKLEIYDSSGGTLTGMNINVDEVMMGGGDFTVADDLNPLDGSNNAGLSLWKDDGDGLFSTSTDTKLGTQPTSWTQVADEYMDGNYFSQASFTNISESIPTDYTSSLTLFVVASAERINQDPVNGFNVIIPKNGIQMTGGSLGNWPSDWDFFTMPTWLGPVGSGGGMMGSPLVLSEIQIAGGTTTDEFIELYSRDMMEIDMSGAEFTLAYEAAATGNTAEELQDKANWDATFDITTGTVPGNGFYLLAHTDYDGSPTEDATYSTFSLPEAGGFVGLFQGDTTPQLVDLVAYGNATASLAEGGQPAPAPSANGSIERKAFPDSTATKMTTGIHAEKGNGEDSQNNSMDFIVRAAAGPQGVASPAEMQNSMAMSSPILLNEVFFNTDTGQGWIEIRNQGDATVDLATGSKWQISAGETYTFPAGSTLDPGQYGVVYWNGAGTDTATTFYTGNSDTTIVSSDMGKFGGEVVLRNAAGEMADYVQYGGTGFTNEAAASSAGQWMAGDKVPTPLYGQSIGRRTNEPDYNSSGDWQTYNSPSEGAPNMGGDSTAPTAVTSVTLSDTDSTANSGLDGNDVQIVWTPPTTSDPSFDRYEIYLLPSTTPFDDTVHQPIDTIFGGQYQYDAQGVRQATFSYAGAPFITKDSANTALSDGDYVAYIVSVDFSGNRSGTAMSSAATLTGEAYDAGSDTQPPFIMHMGVWNAEAGTALNLIARAVDDRELDATHPLQVLYKVDEGAWQPAVDCTLVESNFYNCPIPSQLAGVRVSYYLKAKDAATTPNYAYFSASPTSDQTGDENEVKTTPFVIELLASVGNYEDGGSDADLSGVVYRPDGTAFADNQWPKIFVEGTAHGFFTPANTTGAFTIPDDTLLSGSLNILAVKEGYKDMGMNVFKGDSLEIYMNEGAMNMMGGGGDSPFITWTAPGPEMMGAPIDIYCSGDCTTLSPGEMPIIIGFDRPMNANTINDQDASNAGSNIYLTTNGQDRVAGKVAYDSNMNEARFYATTHDSLSPGTFYNLVVTQGVTDQNGTPIAGDGSGGAFMTSFTTMMDNTDMWGAGGDDFSSFGGGGMMMPPYVQGVTPSPGSFGIPLNTTISVEFSEPMMTSSINSTNIKLFPITNEANWTVGTAVPASITLDQATQRIATITPTNPLDANASNNGRYIVRVMGAVKSAPGIWMADPSNCGQVAPDTCLANTLMYESDFQVTATSDSTAPTVKGTFPKDGDTGVDVSLSAIEIGFSEGMASSTMTSKNITLGVGSTTINGSVEYDPMGKRAKFIPNNALSPNTQYTLTVGTGITDAAGNALASAYTITFTTGASDTTSPEIMYANGDDFSLAITFSEPMNSAPQTETNRWAASVLNPANYFLNGLDAEGGWSTSPGLVSPYDTADGTPLSTVSGLSFSYDKEHTTVIIEGFSFSAGTPAFQLFVDNVKDKSGNLLSDSGNRASDGSHRNAARGPLLNSTETFGMLGPGGGPGMMGGGMGGPMMDMGSMGMMMAGAFPMNGMAGQTSMYFIDVPTNKAIPSGGKIKVTFPAGFNVASAAKDQYSPVNNDINEWNAGTIGIASVTGNQSSRTIDIVTNGGATQTNDFLHMDIKGIVNSSIPKDFQTEGYTVDIKTFTDDGVLLESITTMPFFLSDAGTNTISGTVTAAGANAGTTTVYLGSPMTGPMEATTSTFAGGSATYSFSNLPDGDYHIFTDPFVSIGGTNYMGNPMPDPIWLSGNDATKNITLEAEGASGAAVTVTLTGDFSTGGSNDDIDIFASSPNGFRVKTVNPNNDDATDADGEGTAGNNITTYDIYLPTGEWMIGIGPAMPKGPMAGPPPMPDWMAPMPTRYVSDGATPGNLSISIAGQTATTVSGRVVDGADAGISNAEVYAYQPGGGFGGANTKTATDGSFTLKVPVKGTYTIGAFKPGLPHEREQTINVQENVTGLTIKMKKPAYTISGKVLNTQSQPVSYAPVWAYQPNGAGHATTSTDSTGNYILYVDSGTWRVEADAPGVGWLQYELPVTVSTSSKSNINLKPASDVSWKTISGKMGIDTDGNYLTLETPFANMPLRAVKYDASGNYLGQEYGGMTDSSGSYSLSVPEGIYRVDTWTPQYGERGVNNLDNDNTLNEAADDPYPNSPANVNATANVSNADIIIVNSDLRDISLVFTNAQAGQEGFVNIEGVDFSGNDPKPNGFSRSFHVSDLSTGTTAKLEDGDYFFFVHVPGLGEFIPIADDGTNGMDPTKKDIIVSGNRTVEFSLPNVAGGETITVSGTVSGPGAGEKDAWVWIGNPANGFHIGSDSHASTGAYSLTIPKLSSGEYHVGCDKPGFNSTEPTSITGTADVTVNCTLTAHDKTITGALYQDANSNGAYDSGESLANGWVWAESENGEKSFTPVDGAGNFSLGVTAGSWKLFGAADGYQDGTHGEILVVSSSNLTGKNIPLSTDSSWSNKQKAKPITPSQGGSVDDTAQDSGTGKASGTGVKLTVPPNALGTSTSSGNITTKLTSAVSQTSSMNPFGGKGKNITATDNSGQPITNLNDYIDMEIVLYKADIEEAGMTNLSKLKTLNIRYWDDTANEWVSLSTTRKAYHKMTVDTEWTLYKGTDTKSGFDAFIDDTLGTNATLVEGTDYDDYKLVLTAKTNHLTVFAPGTSPDGVAPKAPTGLSQSSGSGTSVGLSWDAVTLNADDTAISDLYGYAVYRSTDGTTYSQVNASAVLAGTEAFTDTSTSAWTSYYYKITAGDDDDIESAYSTPIQVCSNKTVSNGTVAANCSITCDSGYSSSGTSCVSSGSPGGGGSAPIYTGGGGGGGSSYVSAYTLPTSSSIRTVDSIKPVSLALSGGVFLRPTTFRDLYNGIKVTVPKDTGVSKSDGTPYKGIILTPDVVEKTDLPASLPSEVGFLKAVSVGTSTGMPLTFNKNFTLTIPLNNTTVPSENIKVMEYDSTAGKYVLAGDGGTVENEGQLQIVVSLGHMSTFVVVNTRGEDLETLEQPAVSTAQSPLITPRREIRDFSRQIPEFLRSPAPPFVDTQKHWAKDYIKDLRVRGVVEGKEDKVYDPDANLSRAELVKIVVKAFGMPVEEPLTAHPFPDVHMASWHAPYIAAAQTHGIVQGYPDGLFRPNLPVSRAEALKIIVRAADQAADSAEGIPYHDVDANEWYAPFVRYSQRKGLVDPIVGTRFAPGTAITRAEIAKAIVKTWNAMQE
ncbi:MAG: Ig-like domain-containing protein [Candidatus Gracilibacteria bacterium]|nr:Ig-like domain-containing protein [Candidatus Gracilibacteria bacterium]